MSDDYELAVAAVRAGNLADLARLLNANPDLAITRIPGFQGRTLLHVATDWPGYLPSAPATVSLLIGAGADLNRRSKNDEHGETPLHWAASSDDVDVALALIDGGADIEVADGSIGTPLDNAIGYGCWGVARLLVDRGAPIEKLWHASALGRMDRLEALLASEPSRTEISQAFWHACAGHQRRTAERLLDAGADPNWEPDYAEGAASVAASGRTTAQQNLLDWLDQLGKEQSQNKG